jgi:hypothetical protein
VQRRADQTYPHYFCLGHNSREHGRCATTSSEFNPDRLADTQLARLANVCQKRPGPEPKGTRDGGEWRGVGSRRDYWTGYCRGYVTGLSDILRISRRPIVKPIATVAPVRHAGIQHRGNPAIGRRERSAVLRRDRQKTAYTKGCLSRTRFEEESR